MSFQEERLTCADCGKEFIFTVGEQEFYQQRGFTNKPKRCEDCRSKKKAQGGRDRSSGGFSGGRGGGPRGPSQKFPATCSRCGTQFDAPFQPKEGRPILCRSCFESNKKF